MRNHIIVLPALALTLLAVACSSSGTPSPESLRPQQERAARAAEQLIGALTGELTAAMKEGGPVHAVRYCADNAQDVTARVAERNGVIMRRVTVRARNAASVPDAFEQELLARFDAQRAAGTLTPSSVIVETREVDGRLYLQYMRPLVMKSQCLTCHGGNGDIPAEVAAVIAERYPGDSATGYAEGDFRGAVSVRVPLED